MNKLNITVLGGGVLGSQIAFQTAYSGFNVVVYDINIEIYSKIMQNFEMLRNLYRKEPNISIKQLDFTLEKISFCFDLKEAVKEADIITESIPEDLQIKKDLYLNLAKHAPEKTIFTTNSSTFVPSDLMEFTGRPEKFLALHFANGLFQHNTAEIMGSPKTDPLVFNSVVKFAEEIGMTPIILKKEQKGYVLNSLLIPFLVAAAELLIKGVADKETIDKTWKIATDSQTGPFEIYDAIGLNTVYNIANSGDVSKKMFAHYLKENYIKKGKLGFISGEGFYKYPRTAVFPIS